MADVHGQANNVKKSEVNEKRERGGTNFKVTLVAIIPSPTSIKKLPTSLKKRCLLLVFETG